MKTLSNFSKLLLATILLTSIIISCTKESVPVPEKPVTGFGQMSYVAKSTIADGKSATSQASNPSTVDVSWSSATVYVEKISFTGKTSKLMDTVISIERNVDILKLNGLAGVIKLPSGTYKDVAVKLYCRKSLKSDLAFSFRGTFTNPGGTIDSVLVGSSYPFEAALSVPEVVINPNDNFAATFSFDLTKVLTGISTSQMLTARYYIAKDGKKTYAIFKGGSADEPFYDLVIRNWQSVASVSIDRTNLN
ncbi:hypothetical protein ACXZ1K_01150 [Pedobacter sp. PWIIR3]